MKNLPLLLLLLTTQWLFGEDPSGEQKSTVDRNFVAKDVSDWAKGATYAKVFLFDYRKDERFRPLLKDGKLHSGVVPKFTKRLSAEQYEVLTKAVTGKHPENGASLCHWPHHGFVFYNAKDEPVSQLDICFLCGTKTFNPAGLSLNWNFKSLRKLIGDMKLPNFVTEKEWEEFFSSLKVDSK
ncbi:MAG: hypothetical protein Q7Q71_13385 [Verrucomicrobiota bacterium JB023]|nr:hypothetical protein [Verrucomicrobiota bacterium JB023]